MGNRSLASTTNKKLGRERRNSARSNAALSYGKISDNSSGNEQLQVNHPKESGNQEDIESCDPTANGPLLQVDHCHSEKDDQEIVANTDGMKKVKDKSEVQKPTDEERNSTATNKPQIVCSTKPIEFNVILASIPGNPSKVATLKFVKTYPRTVLDLKQGIEEEFSIPMCCQNILVENIQLRDKCSLEFYRVRDGDTLHVLYNSVADVGDVLEIIGSLCSMITYIEGIQPILSSGTPTKDFIKSIPENIFADKVESLAFEYFYPCSSKRANANRLLFVQHSGLELMYKVHKLLLLQPWQNIPIEMQHLEHAILRVLWNITASFSIRTLVLQRPTLNAIVKSFLRVEVPKEGTVTAPVNRFSCLPTVELNRIASEVVYKAAGSLCNLAELPECRMEIASNKQVLKQLIAVISTRTYKYIASLVSVAGMLCLAYSPETHPYLAEKSIIEGIHHACLLDKAYYVMSDAERRLDKLLLTYFSCVFYSQLLTSSPQLFTLEQKITIAQFMSKFLNEATPKQIRNHEVKNGYKWSTVTPFVKVAYYPHLNKELSMEVHKDTSSTDTQTDDDRDKLHMLSIHCKEMGVFSMQNVLYDEEIRDILVREGLLDYIVCMSWNVPHESRIQYRAKELVIYLSQHMQLQPPSLVNVTKAKLASLHFGLDKVMNTYSVHELLSGVYF